MRANPFDEVVLANIAGGEIQRRCDDFGVSHVEILTVDAKKRRGGKKADPLVAVAVRMIPNESEGVCARQGREIALFAVHPLLLWSGERGLERVVVPNARQAAVLAYLLRVNGVNDDAAQPSRLAPSPPSHSYFASSRRAFR